MHSLIFRTVNELLCEENELSWNIKELLWYDKELLLYDNELRDRGSALPHG